MNDDEAFEELCPEMDGAFMQLSTAWDLVAEGSFEIYSTFIEMGKTEEEALVEIGAEIMKGLRGQEGFDCPAAFAAASIISMGLLKIAREKYNAQ